MKIKFLLLVFIMIINSCNKPHNDWLYLYIGTYTDGESEGIYLYKMNSKTGELKYVSVTGNIDNPSFLAIDKTGKYLYAVKELTEFEGKKSGAIAAYKVDAETKALEFINHTATEGGAPCHLIVDKNNEYVLSANYVGGNACAIKISEDGSLGEITGLVQHKGSGPNTGRQEGPHAHSVNMDPQNKYLFVADLGIDKIMIYKLSEEGELKENEPAYAETAPGAGPRHFTFHPNGKFAYVINELDNTVTAFLFNDSTGALILIDSYTTLPDNFEGESYCADIHIHPSGNFLYGSNRGDNSIVIFSINRESGKLTLVGHESTRGNWPRNFTIDPTGKLLLVANQKSNDIFVFNIDQVKGTLNYTGNSAKLPSPVCLLFYDK